MSYQHQEVRVLSKQIAGRRLTPLFGGSLLTAIGEGAQRAISISFTANSEKRTRLLREAVDFYFVDHEVGASEFETILHFEARPLGEAAPELFQPELWPLDRPSEEWTALTMYGHILQEVEAESRDSRHLDASFLRFLSRDKALFSAGLVSARFFAPERTELGALSARVKSHAIALLHDTPDPRRIRLGGRLDMVRMSTRSLGLRLRKAEEIPGTFGEELASQVKALLNQDVVLEGLVRYRPSGSPLRIEVDAIAPVEVIPEVFQAIPKPSIWEGAVEHPNLVLQNRSSGFNTLIGSLAELDLDDEELFSALREK